MYKAEVDAVDPSRLSSSFRDHGSTQHYTELKTTKEMHTDWHNTTFRRYKLMNWWVQSALAGIPEVLCGIRNEQGIVTSLKVFQTRDIPRLGQPWWSSDMCVNFCDKFLSFIKKCVTQDDPRTVFKFYWNGGLQITCTKLYSSGKYEILPEWYIRAMQDPI